MAFLVDSNIIIYSYSSDYEYLRKLIIDESCTVSEISRVEVLGYHALKQEEEEYFKDVFSYVPLILPSKAVFDRAIELRKLYSLKLGDSLIAATALAHNLEVYTRNLADFARIPELKCINPIV